MTGLSRPFVLEACVETIQQGLLAEKNHADRIEFCHRLEFGGVTPDHDLIRIAVNTIKIPVKISFGKNKNKIIKGIKIWIINPNKKNI